VSPSPRTEFRYFIKLHEVGTTLSRWLPQKAQPQIRISDAIGQLSLVTHGGVLIIIFLLRKGTGTHTPTIYWYILLREKLTYAHPQVVKGILNSLTGIDFHPTSILDRDLITAPCEARGAKAILDERTVYSECIFQPWYWTAQNWFILCFYFSGLNTFSVVRKEDYTQGVRDFVLRINCLAYSFRSSLTLPCIANAAPL